MVIPYYVSPELMMQDKAEYARKGTAKGKSIVGIEYSDGIMLMAENPSTSLNKISEIYDRIAFAGVGKYSEFDNLRKIGIRYADIKGYTYSREDVTAKSLANAYSQAIGHIFTNELKPLEVEILVVEVGDDTSKNSMYHISFDGSISDKEGFAVIGGQADSIITFLKKNYTNDLPLNDAILLCKQSLKSVESLLNEHNLEVAVVDRKRKGRKFLRIDITKFESKNSL